MVSMINTVDEVKRVKSLTSASAIFAPGWTREATPRTRRYAEFNIARDIAHQASACPRGLGSSAIHLCASPVLGRLPCRVICTRKCSPQHLPSLLLEGPDGQCQVHRDNLNITLCGKRHTRAPTAPKSRAAHQQSVPVETQSSSGAEIVL